MGVSNSKYLKTVDQIILFDKEVHIINKKAAGVCLIFNS